MEAIVCQAAESFQLVADAPAAADSIVTLTSVEMSFVGGGSLAVQFD
jgi:hypothetical protein